jgi:hypothetical protein
VKHRCFTPERIDSPWRSLMAHPVHHFNCFQSSKVQEFRIQTSHKKPAQPSASWNRRKLNAKLINFTKFIETYPDEKCVSAHMWEVYIQGVKRFLTDSRSEGKIARLPHCRVYRVCFWRLLPNFRCTACSETRVKIQFSPSVFWCIHYLIRCLLQGDSSVCQRDADCRRILLTRWSKFPKNGKT